MKAVLLEAHNSLMDAINTFSLICLVFGLLCAVVAGFANHAENRRIRAAAATSKGRIWGSWCQAVFVLSV